MDISLRDKQPATEQENADANTVTLSPREQSPDGGTFIGEYDPFHLAYIQPALRANPRARPEQPFPVAQLGPEDFLSRNGSSESSTTDGGWHDSRATVRLKSMNQHDRRLINRWWNDQLQRAGRQNFLAVLIGEECGTLTLSGPNNETELHPNPSMSDFSQQSSVFV